MREVVIVSGARTAVGNFMGSLKDIPAAQLGSDLHSGEFETCRPETQGD